MTVYKDSEAVEREQPLPLKYPDVKEFIADRNVLLALCSHGPMLVINNITVLLVHYPSCPVTMVYYFSLKNL